jgi:lipid-binding SYLF domain-containing protein
LHQTAVPRIHKNLSTIETVLCDHFFLEDLFVNLKLLTALALGAGLLGAQQDAGKRLDAAADTFKEIMGTPDKSIPQDLLNSAQCLIIVPGLKKGAFIVGAKYGRGFVSCRKKDGVGWTAPGSIRVEGGSFGLQIGGSETDVFMLVRNESGMKRLLSTKFTLGGDASVAAGPVGRSTQAETDAAMTAEILTWSRSKGLFAGLSLSGATLREDGEWNTELYGRKISNREILTGPDIPPPAAAGELMAQLNRYSSRK